jgi:hypothetical protein
MEISLLYDTGTCTYFALYFDLVPSLGSQTPYVDVKGKKERAKKGKMLLIIAVLMVLTISLTPFVNALAVVRGRVDFGGLPSTNLIVRLDSSPEYQAFVKNDGSFVIRDVVSGLHELSVVDSLRWFTKAIIEVDENGKLTRIVEVLPPPQPNTGPIRRETKALTLKPVGLIDYFEKRQQMSVMSLFANPMMLMMLVTLGLGFIMPKLMENMDPEELKQMQEQMAQQQKVTADPSKAFASLLGGKPAEDVDSDVE